MIVSRMRCERSKMVEKSFVLEPAEQGIRPFGCKVVVGGFRELATDWRNSFWAVSMVLLIFFPKFSKTPLILVTLVGCGQVYNQ